MGRIEIWRDVVGYEGRYEVSDKGNVLSFVIVDTGRLLVPYCIHSGRRAVYLFPGDGSKHGRLISNLVLEAHVGPRPSPKHQACHGRLGIGDDSLPNLSWGTRHKNNYEDQIRDGTLCTGERHGMAKLREVDIREIRRRYYDENESQYSLAVAFNVTRSNIKCIVNYRTWKNVV